MIISCDKNEYEINPKPDYPYLRMWAMENCSSDFEYAENSAKEWEEKVLRNLKKRDFDINKHHLGFIKQKEFSGCGNCRRTGDYIDIEVPEEQRKDLKRFGFISY